MENTTEIKKQRKVYIVIQADPKLTKPFSTIKEVSMFTGISKEYISSKLSKNPVFTNSKFTIIKDLVNFAR